MTGRVRLHGLIWALPRVRSHGSMPPGRLLLRSHDVGHLTVPYSSSHLAAGTLGGAAVVGARRSLALVARSARNARGPAPGGLVSFLTEYGVVSY